MSGTNQYITMIASVATAIQFAYVGELLYAYSVYFGLMTIVAAYVGLKAINIYIKRSGKQSVITIILTGVLTMALISLPLNYILKANRHEEHHHHEYHKGM